MKNSHNIIAIVATLILLWPVSVAARSSRLVSAVNPEMVKNLNVTLEGDILSVSADISLSAMPSGQNREIWLQPIVSAGNMSAQLPVVAVAGHNRYYQGLRHRTVNPTSITWIERKSKDQLINYQAQIPFADWMEGAELSLNVTDKGCCGHPSEDASLFLTTLNFAPGVFEPVFCWITPVEEPVKTREIRGQAYIDFPVSSTEIIPDYRSNAKELKKIRASIDSVRDARDVTIRSVELHGNASPDGSYELNEKLAEGRTLALKAYLDSQYNFDKGVITAQWTAEDWDGLKKWLETSTLPSAKAILAIIDGPWTPDAREWKIKSEYPDDYAIMREEIYPALRSCDYRIEYMIRSYTQADEIISVAMTHPQNLSLAELFKGAWSQGIGSDTFNKLILLAATMYPDSEVANINAANVAMTIGDYVSARNYLSKGGSAGEALHARGVLEAISGNYASARDLFQQASALGIAEAVSAIDQLNNLE